MDPALAANCFEQPPMAGDPEGTFLLAMAHRLDLFDGADPARARTLLTQAAGLGNVSAQITAFLLRRDGSVDFGGMEAVIPWLEAAAATGAPTALRELSKHHFRAGRTGDGVAVLLAAAEAGSSRARGVLARLAVLAPESSSVRGDSLRLIREMTAAPELADDSALLLRVFVESALGQPGTPASDPMPWLKPGEQRGSMKAGIVRLRLERQEDALRVFKETMPLNKEGACLKLVKLASAPAESDDAKRLPRPVFAPIPAFPTEPAASKVRGRVVIRFTVDPAGTVSAPEVIDATHPALASSAPGAVARWRFAPALEEGKPVSARVQQHLRFELE